MRRIQARTLLQYSTAQLWEMLYGQFVLVFDDGQEQQVHYKAVLYSSYFWDFHRLFPKTPLLYRHYVDSVLKGGALTSKTHIEMLGKVFWDVVDVYELKNAEQRDPLVEMMYRITNQVYNDLSYRCENYATSIDILDFVNIVEHQEIKPALEAVDGSRATLERAYDTVLKVLNHSTDMPDNAVIRAFRAKMVNPNQVLQCVAPRGFVTEVDGHIIPQPVTRSFTNGMRSLHNIVAESRPAAKSLYYAEAPLEQAEYFARRLQLLCMTVEKLYYGDCGTTEYLCWRVKGPTFDASGRLTFPGDLKYMVGKYYLNESTQQLEVVTKDSAELIGKSIMLRSPLRCKHRDKHGVCSVCFGKLADNVSPYANLGHLCAATMTQQTGQNILSAKHIETSSTSEMIVLDNLSAKFFEVSASGNSYLINKQLHGTGAKCVVSRDEAFGLTDIRLVNNIMDINPARVSEIGTVGMVLADGLPPTPIVLERNGRPALLTYEFLGYLKTHGWELDANGNYLFDLSNWDFTKPVFRLPDVEYNFSQHSKEIAKVIESRMNDIAERVKQDSPASTLVELFDLVNAKLNVNLALLEIIIYASMVRNLEEDDMGLARGHATSSLGIANMVINGRSLSNALAYEDQTTLIFDPKSFFKGNRPDSVFDAFVTPREAVADRKRRQAMSGY